MKTRVKKMNKEMERLRNLGIILERRFRTGLPPIYLIGRGSGKSYTDFKRFYGDWWIAINDSEMLDDDDEVVAWTELPEYEE